MNNEETKFNNTFFSYRSELDGLRAIAVIAVIINHFNKEILPNLSREPSTGVPLKNAAEVLDEERP